MKRKLAAIIAIVLGMTSVAACSSSGEKEKEAEPEKSSVESKYSAPFEDGKYDPPVSISAVYAVGPAVTFKNGESIENNVHTRWAKENLGIDINYLWTASTQNQAYITKLRLMLSANQEFPDVIPVRGGDVAQELIDSGKVMEVGELFDKFAGKAWKDAMAEDPTVWYPYMRDGKKYGLPVLDYSQNQDAVLWIREDWLKKLNLEAPTTIDELEKVMDAFTNQDPDGNGKKDTYGLAYAGKNGFVGGMASAAWIFGAYGAIPQQWNLKDGQLEYGSIDPGVKQGLAKMKEWVDKGYMPQDVGLYTPAQANEQYNKGSVGIIAGPLWYDGPAGIASVAKNVPGAEVKAYPVPAGPDGKRGTNSTPGVNGVVLLNKDMKNPDAFFVYWNYLFENYANPAPGGEFEYGFAQGYDWDMVDGTPTSARDKVPGGWVPADKYTLTFEGARIPSLQSQTYLKLASGKAPETPFEKKISESVAKSWIEAGAIVEEQKSIAKPNVFTGPKTKTMLSKQELLNTMELEAFTKIIYGKVPLDDFDKFVTQWKSTGGDQITKEVNDWYQSVSGK
ncbi:extracellular solute-binding protein [Paenibacillus sp. HB172176]|uniref:extracellular solute-binding protein n=1 Tax=Paenibacillus sp. HB172176 TaxID=2493690 RepID=UPI00143A5F46|nr:extracellular solute-binding protein [Paenibacillus sp. HB172176]